MTQITELKMLLDIGRHGHRFYFFVLALLIASISLLIFVGMLIMYIGNLRYHKERKKAGFKARVKACLLCRCRIRCCYKKPKRRAQSYICVPLGVGADGQMSPDQSTIDGADSSGDEGCCSFPSLNKLETNTNVDKLDAQIEASRVNVANSVVKIVRATNRVEEIEAEVKRRHGDEDLEEELVRARIDLQDAKREREAAEGEQQLAESHRQQAQLSKEQWDDRQERTVFKTVTFWQHLTTYLLYFICLMNIFITAFGIYGGEPLIASSMAGSLGGGEHDYFEDDDVYYP